MNKKLIIICVGLLFALGISGLCSNQRLTNNALGKIVGGHDGPCGSPSGSCGGFGGGPGNCIFDSNDEFPCLGNCPPYCPSGSGGRHCRYLSGQCWEGPESCSTEITYKCFPSGLGARCNCVQWGTNGDCDRKMSC